MTNFHENIQYYLDTNGQPDDIEKLSPEIITRMYEIFPPSFAGFLNEFGFCSFFDRGLQLCNPDDMRSILALIFEADKDFHHKDVHVYAYSAFGDLYCWSSTLYNFKINLVDCMVFSDFLIYKQEVKATPDHIASQMLPKKRSIEFYDFNDEPLFARCLEHYGKLDMGQCYGYFPALALLGGSDTPMNRIENIKKVQAFEHFAILAQLDTFYLTTTSSDGNSFVKVRPIG
ncbi:MULTISPECIES: GAD-like domain-containing protein [unclassified Bartonella]|uniref:GAD-like domain-containing protein n=1 Tax=unclassified Bartonella TaxID=2645622 RepID=UPI0015F8A73E|nr:MULTISPECIES: GAD-like domain-containing protein [unclassified Bartonella]UXN06803.1 DUF1851 domain-containing protein [Bartonella sp. HY761]